MDECIIVLCPCCNSKIRINKITGEISGDFSCFEEIGELDTGEYEFGEVNSDG